LDCSATDADAWQLIGGIIMRPEDWIRNPKHEIRNPKQMLNPNDPNPKPGTWKFGTLAFRALDLFRISDFGFRNFLVAWLFLAAWCAPARGDGGSVLLSEKTDHYRITVFDSPSPFREGPVDISVLVQDAVTGQPLPQARVTVRMTPPHPSPGALGHSRGGRGEVLEYPATHDVATNKLLQAAQFELPAPGRWRLEVRVEGTQGSATVGSEIDAARRLPPWRSFWPWIAWPIVAIALFSIHEFSRRKRNAGPSSPRH
jgi:hypothetical protein